jgi:hypothetical protein
VSPLANVVWHDLLVHLEQNIRQVTRRIFCVTESRHRDLVSRARVGRVPVESDGLQPVQCHGLDLEQHEVVPFEDVTCPQGVKEHGGENVPLLSAGGDDVPLGVSDGDISLKGSVAVGGGQNHVAGNQARTAPISLDEVRVLARGRRASSDDRGVLGLARRAQRYDGDEEDMKDSLRQRGRGAWASHGVLSSAERQKGGCKLQGRRHSVRNADVEGKEPWRQCRRFDARGASVRILRRSTTRVSFLPYLDVSPGAEQKGMRLESKNARTNGEIEAPAANMLPQGGVRAK